MNQLKQGLLSVCLLLLFLIATPFHAANASPANMTVEVIVDNPSTFWASTYYAKEEMPTSAAEIKLEWSIGNSKTQRETVVLKGKDSGKISIPAEKGSLVNLQVFVVNAKNEKLGTWSLQIINNGKTEAIRVFSPESVQPEFNRD